MSRSTVLTDTQQRVPFFKLGPSSSISFTGTSAASTNAFASETDLIQITATEVCFVEIGESPTATSSSHYLPANQTSPPIRVRGGTDKIAVIRDTTSGTLYISELQ